MNLILQSIMETIALFVALGLLSQFVSARPEEQSQQNQPIQQNSMTQQAPMTEERFLGALGGLASQFLGGGQGLGGGFGPGLGGFGGQGLGGGFGGPGGYYNGYPGGGFGGQGFGGPGFGGGFGRRPYGFGYRNSDEIEQANKDFEKAENEAGKTDTKPADNNQKQ